MRMLTAGEFDAFVASRPLVVIHVDARWDAYRDEVRAKMLAAETGLKDHVAFAEVDCDTEGELCRSLGVANVPWIAYFREGKQVRAGAGAHQDILEHAKQILDGNL